MQYLLQTEAGMCGDIACRNFLALVRHDDRYLLLKDTLPRNATLKALIDHLSGYGLKMAAFRVNDDTVWKKLRAPFIAMQERDGRLHYIVIGRRHRHRALIIDGAEAPRYEDFASFRACLNGIVTIIEEIRPFKLDFACIAIKPPQHTFMITTLYILSLVFLLLGLYFIDEASSFIVPLTFFTLAATSYIGEQTWLAKSLRHYDTDLEAAYGKVSDREKLRDLFEFKQASFTTPIALVNHLVILGFLTVFLAINDPANLIVITIIFIYKLAEELFVAPRFATSIREISRLETLLFVNRRSFQETMPFITHRSYRLTHFLLVRKAIRVFVIMALTLLLMAYRSTVYLNYFMFETGSLLLISNALNQLMDHGKERQRYFQLAYFFFVI